MADILPRHSYEYLVSGSPGTVPVDLDPEGPEEPIRDVLLRHDAALRATVEAARHLVAALDYTTPSWRAETLKAGKDGDEVNAAWDELIAALEGGAVSYDTSWTDDPLCPYCGKGLGYGPEMSDGLQDCAACGRYCKLESDTIRKFTTTKPVTVRYQGVEFIRADGPWWLCVECSKNTRLPEDHAAEPHESRAALKEVRRG